MKNKIIINYKKIFTVGGIVVFISAAVFGCVKHFNGKHDVKEYQEKYRKVHRDLVNAAQEFTESEEEE